MLCPKRVKRYLQGSHPERLLDPLMRTAEGFRPAAWDEALDFTARRLRELQEKYGPDSVAVYGGASLTTEKAYLMGKFARVALGTRHIDYNGRLCMVSAGTAYKGALGVDRAPNPWSYIAAHTTGFEKTAESVEPWNPRRAAEVTGVAPDAIERAAHWVGESRRAMLMHARGLEHHSKGVENCEAVVAIALVTGNIGREG